MLSRRNEIVIGLGVMALAACLLWWVIPTQIDMPQRVRFRALSPAFWPKVISWTMLACGVALTLSAIFGPKTPRAGVDSLAISRPEGLRLAALAVILLATFLALPVLGMVWTCMLAYAALLLLTGGRQMGWGLAVAVLLPIVLYLFFSKVAGVAIPQGQIVRLP